MAAMHVYTGNRAAKHALPDCFARKLIMIRMNVPHRTQPVRFRGIGIRFRCSFAYQELQKLIIH